MMSTTKNIILIKILYYYVFIYFKKLK